MTLDDVFQPNQYGTIPIIDIFSIGTIIKYSDTEARVLLEGCDTQYIPLNTECMVTGYEEGRMLLKVNQAVLRKYNKGVFHLKLADSSERLIINAINPNTPMLFTSPNGALHYLAGYESYQILANGTGWVVMYNDNEQVPVTFFYEDILYRLDLQGELK